jgi:hypothetical protein
VLTPSLDCQLHTGDAGTAERDCSAGCPLTPEPHPKSGVAGPVCGANGVTFINQCVAECSGRTTVAYDGPCAVVGRGGAAAAAGAPYGAAIAAASVPPSPPSISATAWDPIARFLAIDGSSGAAALAGGSVAPRLVSAKAMRRFADEGMVLVGPASLANFQPTKPADDPSGMWVFMCVIVRVGARKRVCESERDCYGVIVRKCV